MGPLALLDFVGLDVAVAIGERASRRQPVASPTGPPELIHELVADGKLGRKSGRRLLRLLTLPGD